MNEENIHDKEAEEQRQNDLLSQVETNADRRRLREIAGLVNSDDDREEILWTTRRSISQGGSQNER